jgi:hypothetical protein
MAEIPGEGRDILLKRVKDLFHGGRMERALIQARKNLQETAPLRWKLLNMIYAYENKDEWDEESTSRRGPSLT